MQGDVILDCGAYGGDTGRYFSEKAGPAGHVYCFEPGSVYERLEKNLRAFGNITFINAGVSDVTGKCSFVDTGGSDARIGSSDGGNQTSAISTITIDDFVAAYAPQKIDFIKMDIEGSEYGALQGARQTISRLKPRMAISAYHICYDPLTLPILIREILPSYRFYLRGYTYSTWELVLYCVPDRPETEERCRPQNNDDEVDFDLFNGQLSFLTGKLLSAHVDRY